MLTVCIDDLKLIGATNLQVTRLCWYQKLVTAHSQLNRNSEHARLGIFEQTFT